MSTSAHGVCVCATYMLACLCTLCVAYAWHVHLLRTCSVSADTLCLRVHYTLYLCLTTCCCVMSVFSCHLHSTSHLLMHIVFVCYSSSASSAPVILTLSSSSSVIFICHHLRMLIFFVFKSRDGLRAFSPQIGKSQIFSALHCLSHHHTCTRYAMYCVHIATSYFVACMLCFSVALGSAGSQHVYHIRSSSHLLLASVSLLLCVTSLYAVHVACIFLYCMLGEAKLGYVSHSYCCGCPCVWDPHSTYYGHIAAHASAVCHP